MQIVNSKLMICFVIEKNVICVYIDGARKYYIM